MKDADDVLKMPIDTLLAAFFNAEDKNGNFAIVSNYRETTYMRMIPGSHRNTAEKLRRKYDLPFMQVGNTKIEATISTEEAIHSKNSAIYYTKIFSRNSSLQTQAPTLTEKSH